MTKKELEYIFGPESRGNTEMERARTSARKFMRGQDHLAVYEGQPEARVLSAFEAYAIFGIDLLQEAVEEGAAIIVPNKSEPSRTLRKRREALGITEDELARYLGLGRGEIQDAEDSSKRTPIRHLERIGVALGLDESRISVAPGAGGDSQLAYRFRTLIHDQATGLKPRDVLHLDEAAWVILTQSKLFKWLSNQRQERWKAFTPSDDYGSPGLPAWDVGYRLAIQTRLKLGLERHEPIASLSELCSRKLDIAHLQAELPPRIAGLTLGNGSERGMVANIIGNNQNVWVRRMTMAHELGHLLWDPDEKLEKLQVDDYDKFEDYWDPTSDSADRQKYIESRANAFAVEFLAPQLEVKRLFQKAQNLRAIMDTFGVSYTAAKYQTWNAFDRTLRWEELTVESGSPSQEWEARETYAADYFPIRSTPVLKTGLFAGLVVEAQARGLISEDTASQYLSCTIKEYRDGREAVQEIHPF